MTIPARGSGSLCLHKDFWDRHRTNITTRQKVVYLDVETTFRHIFPTDKLQCLSRGRSQKYLRKHTDPDPLAGKVILRPPRENEWV